MNSFMHLFEGLFCDKIIVVVLFITQSRQLRQQFWNSGLLLHTSNTGMSVVESKNSSVWDVLKSETSFFIAL